jgi:hypothetical protein
MKSIFIFILLVTVKSLFSQPVKYSYDNNGARIQRKPVSIYESRLALNLGGEEKEKDKKAKEIEQNHGISLAPNPTKAIVHLTVNDLADNETATYYLLDFNGKVLDKKQMSTNTQDVDLSSYAQGMYFIRVLINKESLYYKVVKE